MEKSIVINSRIRIPEQMKLSKNAKEDLNIFTQNKLSPKMNLWISSFKNKKIKLREQNIMFIFQDKADPLLTLQKFGKQY